MRSYLRYVDSADGTRIECLVFEPARASDRPDAPTEWFILAHAHPKLGGNRAMMTPLARVLSARGHGAVAVAARGTSGSLGSSSWRGNEAEGEDVCAAVDWVTKTFGARARTHVVGYSYGSTTCAYALERRSTIMSYVAIGYPRGSLGCGFMGFGAKLLMRDHASKLEASGKAKLFVHPSRDEFTTVATVEAFMRERLPEDSVKELRVLEGIGHFDASSDPEALESTARWIEEFVRRVNDRDEGDRVG